MQPITTSIELILYLATLLIPVKRYRVKVRQKLNAYILKNHTRKLVWLHQLTGRKKRIARNLITEPLCKNKRCIVVGSAPGLRLPIQQTGDIIIGANGGAGIAQQAGREVDIFCTTAWLFINPNRQDTTTRKSLALLKTHTAYIYAGAEKRQQPILADYEITAETTRSISVSQYLQIVESACGLPLRVSTGIFAVCLAVISGATCIEIVGFSLSSGHEGMPWDKSPRDHIPEDTACLREISHRHPNLKLIIHHQP